MLFVINSIVKLIVNCFLLIEPKIWLISGANLEISINTNLEDRVLLRNNDYIICSNFKGGSGDTQW